MRKLRSPGGRRPGWRATLYLLAGLPALAGIVGAPGASANHSGFVTVRITQVVNVGDEGLEDNIRGPADMYAGVTIFGQTFNNKSTHVDDEDVVNAVDNPNWTFSRSLVAGTPDVVPVSIEIWDHDDCDPAFCSGGLSGDDRGDVDPQSGSDTLDLLVDRTTGAWSGDATSPDGCSQGDDLSDGDRRVRVCWDISTSLTGDADGDGLLDGWERFGFDADGDGTVDVNLPAFGANPLHKDLFLEFDWVPGQEPSRAAVQAMKQAFAAAPVGAGGVNNPDGLPGINIWVDTGALVDGGGVLVGDNLGGGNPVADNNMNNLDANFYATKAANFNAAARRWIFRYAISGDPADSTSGGQGEIGGNDFIEYNHDGGTIMHELGHNLNLRHGGFENANCKPNYVSVMNYDLQFGIPQAGGGAIIDYSPPRFAGGRGNAPLPTLQENNLGEATILDASDATNRFVFTNAAGNKVQNPLNAGADWNGDGDTTDTGLAVNVDTNQTGGGPAACANGSTNGTHAGHDDWSVVSLPFRQFGDSADGAINPVLDDEPELHELHEQHENLNRTDLSITMTDSPDPVAAGTDLTYTLTVTNGGPNPASDTRVVDTLPAGVTYQSDTGGCVEAPAGTLTCDLGELLANTTRVVTVTVHVDPDLVYDNGGPVTITNTASVTNQAGPDPDPADNTVSEDTTVVAVADLAVVGVGLVDAPAEIVIGETRNVTIETTITNHGPSAPMDVRVANTASASSGATAVPAATSVVENALGEGEQRTLSQVVTISCEQPGEHTYTFARTISPANAADTDPNSLNDAGEASFTLDCVVPVAVNIKPGSVTNPVNTGSNGGIPLAVLTTAAGEYDLPLAFDATTIDPLLTRFGTPQAVNGGGGATEMHGQGHPEDSYELNEVVRDGDLDMVMHYRTQQTGFTATSTKGCVKGKFRGTDGGLYTFFGCDSIVVVP